MTIYEKKKKKKNGMECQGKARRPPWYGMGASG
jgi:hypothetical protein